MYLSTVLYPYISPIKFNSQGKHLFLGWNQLIFTLNWVQIT